MGRGGGRSRGHAPFEKLLGEARREAGLKNWAGQSPALLKADQADFLEEVAEGQRSCSWLKDRGVELRGEGRKWLKDREEELRGEGREWLSGWLWLEGQRKSRVESGESGRLGERPNQRRHGREMQQRRSCRGPARLGEKCRRGFAGRERSPGQAGPR